MLRASIGIGPTNDGHGRLCPGRSFVGRRTRGRDVLQHIIREVYRRVSRDTPRAVMQDFHYFAVPQGTVDDVMTHAVLLCLDSWSHFPVRKYRDVRATEKCAYLLVTTEVPPWVIVVSPHGYSQETRRLD